MQCKLLKIILFFSLLILGFVPSNILFAQDSIRYTLAVLDLEPNGVSQVEGRGLSDKLRSHISQLIQNRSFVKDSYDLIERTQMDKILGQFEIQNTGCVSDSCAVEFGKMLQADRIVIGSVSLIGQTYSVIIRIVDVESGKTIRSADKHYKGAIDEVLINIIPQIGTELLTGNKIITPLPTVQQIEVKIPVKTSISNLLKEILGKEFYMVSIPGGSFKMGSNDNARDEKPVHTVLLDGFEMSSTEVTQKQYLIIMGKNPSTFKGNDNLPIENVSLFDAVKFCNMLSELVGLEKCYTIYNQLMFKLTNEHSDNKRALQCDFGKNGFRLPTEAEWEYACRAGTTKNYYTGDSESDIAMAGWYKSNSESKTHFVKQREPNAWGLYDMHGNVWEWCQDLYGRYESIGLRHPKGAQNGKYYVIRGGSYNNRPKDCRTTNRHFISPNQKKKNIGFRVVRHIAIED